MKTVLLVNHNAVQCGIAQYGRDLYACLKGMEGWDVRYLKASDGGSISADQSPRNVIIYNYATQTMPWIDQARKADDGKPRICIRHDDMTEDAANREAQGGFFSHFVYPNPAVGRKPPYVFTTGRLVPEVPGELPLLSADMPTVGTFGFATGPKRLDWFAKEVRENWPKGARIRIHMPINPFADPDGKRGSDAVFRLWQSLGEGFSVIGSHDYLSTEIMVRWLRGNHLNVFLYGPEQKGISSALDLAIAAGRPIALNRVPAFAHMTSRSNPSPFVEDYAPGEGFRHILASGDNFQDLQVEWCPERLRQQWKHILEEVTA